jgi:hypothetical protein
MRALRSASKARGSRLVQATWNHIRDHIERKRAGVNHEIKNYPPPIPACDQQFNYLLEERGRIVRELARLDTYAEQSRTRVDAKSLIDEFISSSAYIDVAVKRAIRSSLKETARTPAARKRRSSGPVSG